MPSAVRPAVRTHRTDADRSPGGRRDARRTSKSLGFFPGLCFPEGGSKGTSVPFPEIRRAECARRLAKAPIILIELGDAGLARSERFELPTLGFEVRCSIQLSYERVGPFRGAGRDLNSRHLPG